MSDALLKALREEEESFLKSLQVFRDVFISMIERETVVPVETQEELWCGYQNLVVAQQEFVAILKDTNPPVDLLALYRKKTELIEMPLSQYLGHLPRALGILMEELLFNNQWKIYMESAVADARARGRDFHAFLIVPRQHLGRLLTIMGTFEEAAQVVRHVEQLEGRIRCVAGRGVDLNSKHGSVAPGFNKLKVPQLDFLDRPTRRVLREGKFMLAQSSGKTASKKKAKESGYWLCDDCFAWGSVKGPVKGCVRFLYSTMSCDKLDEGGFIIELTDNALGVVGIICDEQQKIIWEAELSDWLAYALENERRTKRDGIERAKLEMAERARQEAERLKLLEQERQRAEAERQRIEAERLKQLEMERQRVENERLEKLRRAEEEKRRSEEERPARPMTPPSAPPLMPDIGGVKRDSRNDVVPAQTSPRGPVLPQPVPIPTMPGAVVSIPGATTGANSAFSPPPPLKTPGFAPPPLTGLGRGGGLVSPPSPSREIARPPAELPPPGLIRSNSTPVPVSLTTSGTYPATPPVSLQTSGAIPGTSSSPPPSLKNPLNSSSPSLPKSSGGNAGPTVVIPTAQPRDLGSSAPAIGLIKSPAPAPRTTPSRPSGISSPTTNSPSIPRANAVAPPTPLRSDIPRVSDPNLARQSPTPSSVPASISPSLSPNGSVVEIGAPVLMQSSNLTVSRDMHAKDVGFSAPPPLQQQTQHFPAVTTLPAAPGSGTAVSPREPHPGPRLPQKRELAPPPWEKKK